MLHLHHDSPYRKRTDGLAVSWYVIHSANMGSAFQLLSEAILHRQGSTEPDEKFENAG
jgi:hypothetical protein